MSEDLYCCVTLDLENDWYFEQSGYDHLTLQYLDDFIQLIQEVDVPLSVFVVGKTIEKFPHKIDQLKKDLDTEFHLHSYQHDVEKNYDFRSEIRRGKTAFCDHFGRNPIGYRAPQGNIEPDEIRILEEEGFLFDSSIFPSYRPGIYNNVTKPRQLYIPEQVNELIEIPIGTTGARIPTSQSYFKLLGGPLIEYLSISNLPNVLVYNLHLQDLYRTDSYERLSTQKRMIFERNLPNSKNIFKRIIKKIDQRGYEFCRMSNVLNQGVTQSLTRGKI
ncbi:Polysaccharide deacetylase [Halogranum amylolyticum]|uniref:Polysaccharide deacetylase n=1 Tax=Halogranum amylolyticum TaxID=660520 RepID=A0A1H8WQ01_9EURY|nr:polysaccharide deacetylase family protein [Halogranum amylolyticum]SEP29750.1 Polysaccharide deacetylase [Halogranum amylolyticum]